MLRKLSTARASTIQKLKVTPPGPAHDKFPQTQNSNRVTLLARATLANGNLRNAPAVLHSGGEREEAAQRTAGVPRPVTQTSEDHANRRSALKGYTE